MPSEALAKEGGFGVVRLSAGNDAVAGQRYVGVTADLDRRLIEHNTGKSIHTSKFRPWRIVTYLAFSEANKAASFEHYLKSGSGHAFAGKRLW